MLFCLARKFNAAKRKIRHFMAFWGLEDTPKNNGGGNQLEKEVSHVNIMRGNACIDFGGVRDERGAVAE